MLQLIAVLVATFAALAPPATWAQGDTGCAVAMPAADGMAFAGNGTGVTESFRLEEGTTLFTIESTPTDGGFLNINRMPAPGSNATGFEIILFVENEPVSETNAKPIRSAGDYILSVEGDGDWSVEVRQ